MTNVTDCSSIERALAHLTHGVYILGTRRGQELAAMTSTWVMQVSDHPPCIGVSVKSNRYTHNLILDSEIFALSILREDQVHYATHFGISSSEYHDKMLDVPYQKAPSGAPVLLDCVAYLDCRMINTVHIGDHTVFIGEVTAAEVVGDAPSLVYDAGDYDQGF